MTGTEVQKGEVGIRWAGEPALLQALLPVVTSRGRPGPHPARAGRGRSSPPSSPPGPDSCSHPPPPTPAPPPPRPGPSRPAEYVISALHSAAGPSCSTRTSHEVGFLVGRFQLLCVYLNKYKMRPRVTTTQGKKIRLAEPLNVSLQVTPPQVSAMLTFTVTTSLPFSAVYPQGM